jgi:hypothetical protein
MKEGCIRISIRPLFHLLALLAVLGACTNTTPPATSPWSEAGISDFKNIAGQWEGLMRRAPEMRSDDWVQVSIRDDGMYAFKSFRTIGVFSGRGQLTLNQGKATRSTDHGELTFVLYEANGVRMLRARATKDGIEYASDLTPAK